MIIPSIYEKEFAKVQDKLHRLTDLVTWVQIDVTDNQFTPGFTFSLELLSRLKDHSFLWDIHLMVKNPISWIGKCDFIAASQVTGHIEQMADQKAFIDRCLDYHLDPALALDIATPLEVLDPSLFPSLNSVLLLGRQAGLKPHSLDPQIFEKIKTLKKIRDQNHATFKISVDGGINRQNAPDLLDAGADDLCITSALFTENLSQNLQFFQSL
jgi:ribulose-phosphate 3-epimerase